MSDTIPGPSLESQIIFRLASMEANLTSGFKHIHEKIDGLQKESNTWRIDAAKEFVSIKAKQEQIEDKFEDRIKSLELFKTEILAKATALAAGVGFLWMLFGDAVKRILGVN